MANVDTHEEFWGITLTNDKKTYTWDPTADSEEDVEHKIQVTQACLGYGAKAGERNLIEVVTEDDDGNKISCPIVSLSVGGKECLHLELGFNNTSTFTLREGSGPIGLSGVHLQALPLDLEDDDGESEDESEDEEVPKLVEQVAGELKIVEVEPLEVVGKKVVPVEEKVVEVIAEPETEEKEAKPVVAAVIAVEKVEEKKGKKGKKRAVEEAKVEVAEKKKKEEPVVVEKEAAKKTAPKKDAKKKDLVVEESVDEEEGEDSEEEETAELVELEAKEASEDEESEDGEEPEHGDVLDSSDDEVEDDDEDDSDDDDLEGMLTDDDDEDMDSEDESEEEEAPPPPPTSTKKNKKPLVNGHGKPTPKKDTKTDTKAATPAPKATKADTKAATPAPKGKKQDIAKTPIGNKNEVAAKTPKSQAKKNPEELKAYLLKSPNLPKTYGKFANLMKNNMKVTDDSHTKELWEFVQKNKK